MFKLSSLLFLNNCYVIINEIKNDIVHVMISLKWLDQNPGTAAVCKLVAVLLLVLASTQSNHNLEA